MIRYTLFVTVVLGSAATAIAAIASGTALHLPQRNITVIEKNQAFPVFGPIVVERCGREDCADTAG